MPSPAPRSTVTRWPCATSSRALVGVNPTRYSWTLISFGTPMSMPVSFRPRACAANNSPMMDGDGARPIAAATLRGHVARVLEAGGSAPGEAATVADHLVEANLRGHD